MKTKLLFSFYIFIWLTLVIFTSQVSTVLAQGSLTPPGDPAPSMLTLNQIKPRTPIGCIGQSTGGTGIFGAIANSCYRSSGDAHITHAYNMP